MSFGKPEEWYLERGEKVKRGRRKAHGSPDLDALNAKSAREKAEREADAEEWIKAVRARKPDQAVKIVGPRGNGAGYAGDQPAHAQVLTGGNAMPGKGVNPGPISKLAEAPAGGTQAHDMRRPDEGSEAERGRPAGGGKRVAEDARRASSSKSPRRQAVRS